MKSNQIDQVQNQQRPSPVSMTAGLIAGFFLTFAAVPSRAAPGDLDLSFDPGSTVNSAILDMAVQSDGDILIGGLFSTVHGAMRTGLARLHPNGTTELSFNVSLSGNTPTVKAVTVQADGKILIGGSFASVNGIGQSNLARLNPDGSLDQSFTNRLSDVSGIALQQDGKVLVAGGFTNVNGIERRFLARLHGDGSLDETFLDGLAGPDNPVCCMVIQEDGKILIAGQFNTVNSSSRSYLARLNPDGSLDPSFLTGLSGPNNWLQYVCLQPDYKIIIGGFFSSVNGMLVSSVVRLNADGTLDATFTSAVQGYKNGVSRIAVQKDGKVLLGGCLGSIGQNQSEGIARLNQDGSRDSTYMGSVSAEDDTGVRAMVLNGDDTLVVAGGSMTSVIRPFLFKLGPDGNRDNRFSNGPSGTDGDVKTVAIQADGRVLLGGSFRTYNGESRGGLARLNSDGSLDPTFLDGLVGAGGRPVWSIALQSDGRVLIAGEFSTVNGVAHQGIARLNADGSLDNAFNPNLEGYGRYVYAVALQSDGRIIIGGSFTSVNGLARTNVARLNPDGSSDPSFTASAYGSLASVQALVLQPDGRIVIGGFFSMVNGASRNRIARLNNNGSLDTSFLNGLSGADQAVWSIAVQNDGKTLVGGWFGRFNGLACNYFVRLNANGTVDTSFLAGLAGPNGGPSCLALQDDGKILVGGGFSSFNRVARNNLARLNADGSLDGSFLNGLAGADQGVRCLALLADSRMVIGGEFTVINQIPRNSAARLMGDSVAPVITTSPSSQTAELGTSIRLAVHATGVPTPCCQWYCNGSVIPGGTNAVLELVNLQSAHIGSYTVVLTNISGAVTSAPVLLNVILLVERKPVPGVKLMGEAGSLLNVDYADSLSATPSWLPLDTVTLAGTSQYYFDLTMPLPPQRFYQAWQAGASGVIPLLDLHLVPAITLTGSIGRSVRVDYINRSGPIDAWVTLDTVTLTNTSQLYFDTSSIGQPARLWRIVPVP